MLQFSHTMSSFVAEAIAIESAVSEASRLSLIDPVVSQLLPLQTTYKEASREEVVRVRV